MKAQDFRKYLGQPRKIYELPLTELQELALQYPYSPNVRLLLLLKTHLDGHPEEEAYLNRCAAASFDRAHLRDILRELDAVVENEAEEEILELRELDELNLEPVLAKDSEDINLQEESIIPPISSATDVLDNEDFSVPFEEEMAPEEMFNEADTPLTEEPIVPAPVSDDLKKRLARIRYLQEARNEDVRKEDVNRIARRSLVAHEEVASETLASLLVRQGQYQNAIRMYQRLILLYPEKKTIFAGLIKELKEKL